MTQFLLTPHFQLAEFERSAIAQRHGIRNTCPSEFIPALEQLCRCVLEPLREYAGQPIIIGSGYRCNELNIRAGGVYASQHTLGEAADIQVPKTPYTAWDDGKAHTDMELLNRWFEWIVSHTNFDQAIIETANGRDFWIHVSCRRNILKNRHQVIRLPAKD